MLWGIKTDSYDRCGTVRPAVSPPFQWCCVSDYGVSKSPPASKDTKAVTALVQFSFLTNSRGPVFPLPNQCCQSSTPRITSVNVQVIRNAVKNLPLVQSLKVGNMSFSLKWSFLKFTVVFSCRASSPAPARTAPTQRWLVKANCVSPETRATVSPGTTQGATYS